MDGNLSEEYFIDDDLFVYKKYICEKCGCIKFKRLSYEELDNLDLNINTLESYTYYCKYKDNGPISCTCHCGDDIYKLINTNGKCKEWLLIKDTNFENCSLCLNSKSLSYFYNIDNNQIIVICDECNHISIYDI